MKKTLVVAAFAAATLASLTAGSASTQAGFGWEAGPHKAFGWNE